ncbi:MAG: Fur family transcriptional regulator [Gammaproteobacteria bacterium]|nr:Fur family transcriptional regulator [Gammaproteobacteria bacterium]
MPDNIVIQDFEPHEHDHGHCMADALREAERVCAQRGERFTPLRRTVFELLWSSHKPVKAYDLLAQLAVTHDRPAPPTVYRTLDFLQEAGLVHKLESLNAYIGCGEPGRRHQGQFMICEECGVVAELDDEVLTAMIDTNARKIGFKVNDETIEISGLCRQCQ